MPADVRSAKEHEPSIERMCGLNVGSASSGASQVSSPSVRGNNATSPHLKEGLNEPVHIKRNLRL